MWQCPRFLLRNMVALILQLDNGERINNNIYEYVLEKKEKPFWKRTAVPQCMPAVSLCNSTTDPHQIRLLAGKPALAKPWAFSDCEKSVNKRVKCYVICLVSSSPFQDLATSGGDCEDGESLCHHHHTLHRRGPASQCGEIINLCTNTHTHTHREATCMHINTQGQIKHKCRLINETQNQ